MNVLHLSHYAGKGGAWTAIDGLNRQLQKAGATSRILCANAEAGLADRPDIARAKEIPGLKKLGSLLPYLAELPQAPWMRGHWRNPRLHTNWLPRFRVESHPWLAEADVVHVQWITLGLLTPEQLARLNKPLVISLLDLWPITGGCPYTFGCGKYAEKCGACPQIESSTERDVSRLNWHRKKRAYAACEPIFVTLSRSMADDASRSPLVQGRRIETIPSGIDTDTFCPGDAAASRALLKLPPDLPLILFGAQIPSEPRKGFDLLLEAVRRMHAKRGPDFGLAIYGTTKDIPWADIPVPSFDLGRLETPLRLHSYRAAQVFAAPSREENFASTVLEAMASGCPVTAFRIGGMPDAITHGETGFLAKPFDCAELATHLGAILDSEALRLTLSARSRQRALEKYSLDIYAGKYLQLYQSLAPHAPREPTLT